MSDVSNQHLFETIRHGHAICLDRINPDSHILNGFWSRDQMAVVLARVRALETGLAWYADLDNYLGHCPATLDDLGTRARAALAGEP